MLQARADDRNVAAGLTATVRGWEAYWSNEAQIVAFMNQESGIYIYHNEWQGWRGSLRAWATEHYGDDSQNMVSLAVKYIDNQWVAPWSVRGIQGSVIRRLRAVASIKNHDPWPSSSFTPGFHWLKERPNPLEEGPWNTHGNVHIMCPQFFPQRDIWTFIQATIKFGKGKVKHFGNG